MSRLVLLAMPGNEAFAARLAARLDAEQVLLEQRRFPDGESYLRLHGDVGGANVVVVCTLADPDPQFLSLVFAAETARHLGAARLTLVVPYLAYMRQDAIFHPGEALTSATFARLLSGAFDAMVTVDPHLHRYKDLSEIYTIPAMAAHAGPLLGRWIKAQVERPLVVGPDAESLQWVEKVAAAADAPSVLLIKSRSGDRRVEVALPDLGVWRGCTPVLVDDVISSGMTMVEAAAGLARAGFPPPVCVAVHALFAGDAYARLKAVTRDIVSTDSIPHHSNRIGLAELIAERI